MKIEPRFCLRCGVEVGPRRHYCDDCNAELNRERVREYKRRRMTYKRAQRGELELEYEPMTITVERRKENSLSIAEINGRARQQGVTYGQLVAQMKM